MDQKYIEDNHVVARYLADQLSESDRQAFEAFCLANPSLFREIEAAARFKVGLEKLETSKRLHRILEQPIKNSFAQRRAAVVAGLVVGAGVLYGSVVSLQVPVMGATVAAVSGKFKDPLPLVGSYELLRMRTTEATDPVVTLPASPGVIEFRVLPEDESATSYVAELRRIEENTAETLMIVDGLTPDEDRFVTLYLNSAKLTAGTYEIATGSSSGSRAELSALRITTKSADKN